MGYWSRNQYSGKALNHFMLDQWPYVRRFHTVAAVLLVEMLYVHCEVWNCQPWTLHCLLIKGSKQHRGVEQTMAELWEDCCDAAMALSVLFYTAMGTTDSEENHCCWFGFFAVLCFAVIMKNKGVKKRIIMYVLQIQITEVFISIRAKQRRMCLILLRC